MGGKSSRTLENRRSALRAVFTWMYPRSNTEGRPLQELEPPVVIDKVIEPLTHEQIAKIFDSMNPNTVLGARNKAIYSLMLTPASGYSKSPT